MFDKLMELWRKYWDWLMSLPEILGVLLSLATVIIPMLMGVSGLIAVLDLHFKKECLDNQLARRWSPTERICEEYHDDKWVEVDLSGDNIYYYNGVASREH